MTGRWLAVADESKGVRGVPVNVWNTTTGQQCLRIPSTPDQFVDVLRFSHNQFLLIGGRTKPDICVWDVAQGKQLPAITLPSRGVRNEHLAFTADGEFYAAVDRDQLLLCSTRTRQAEVILQTPPTIVEFDEQSEFGPREIHGQEAISGLEVLRFSPDGSELAGVTEHSGKSGTRLLCWNVKGRLVLNQPIPRAASRFAFDPVFDWLPDGSGWIISGHVFDRTSKRFVFATALDSGDDPLFFPLDRDRLLGTIKREPNELRIHRIPWDVINHSLQVITDGAPAAWGPHLSVHVQVEFGELRGDAEPVNKLIIDAITFRLAQDGIQCAATSDTAVKLRFSEQVGDALPIYERSLGEFEGHDTGRTVREAQGTLDVEILHAGELVWHRTLPVKSNRSFDGEINDVTVRQSMLNAVKRALEGLSMPYFIPLSPDQAALPIWVD